MFVVYITHGLAGGKGYQISQRASVGSVDVSSLGIELG
jgi:hypothetical protein